MHRRKIWEAINSDVIFIGILGMSRRGKVYAGRISRSRAGEARHDHAIRNEDPRGSFAERAKLGEGVPDRWCAAIYVCDKAERIFHLFR